MTKAALAKRVEFWRQRICPEWRVLLLDDRPDDMPQDADALCIPIAILGQARIYFDPSILDYDQAEVDRIVVHELLHPLLARVTDQDEMLQPHVSATLMQAYFDSRHTVEEEFVNRLAHIIVGQHHGHTAFRTD